MVDMAVSHCGTFIVNLVPDTRGAEAFPGDVSLSAGGCAACEWFGRKFIEREGELICANDTALH